MVLNLVAGIVEISNQLFKDLFATSQISVK